MPKPLILCYHAVSPTWPANLASTPERLRDHCSLLRSSWYQAKTLSDALTSPSRRPSVVITFDDAFRSVYEVAKPILDEFGFPATIFVPTGFVEAGEPMSWPGIDHWIGTEHESDLRPMTWDQLRACQEDGWEIGSHTVTHPHLPLATDAELARELGDSRATCEAEMGRPCPSIAYPFGDHDERVVAAAADAGYEIGVTLPGRIVDGGPLERARVGVYRTDNRTKFTLKISPTILSARRSRAWPAVTKVARGQRRS